jgi:heat shock protein 5
MVLSRPMLDSDYHTSRIPDLGSTTSSIAVHSRPQFEYDRDHRVDVIANSQGHRTTPTWVAFGDEGHLVGAAARNASDYMSIRPENIVFDAKRLIGRSMEDAEVQKEIRMKQWPFTVHADKGGRLVYNVKTADEYRDFTPQDILTLVLGQIKETAEAYLGVKVEHAVITVPTCMHPFPSPLPRPPI